MRSNLRDSALLGKDIDERLQQQLENIEVSKERSQLSHEKDRHGNDPAKTNVTGQGHENRIEETKQEEKKEGKSKDLQKKNLDGSTNLDQIDPRKPEENKKDINSKNGINRPGIPKETPKPEVKKTVEEDLAGFFDDPKPDPKNLKDGKNAQTQGEKKIEEKKNISQKIPFTNDPFEDDDVFGDPKPKKEHKGSWPEPDVKKKDVEAAKQPLEDKKLENKKSEEKPKHGEDPPGKESRKDDKIKKDTGGLFDDDFFDALPEKNLGGLEGGDKGKPKEIIPGKKVEQKAEEKVKIFEVLQ